MEAATHVRAELDIAPHSRGQACIMLSRMEAVTLVAVAAAKHATGAVEKPNAWLRAMVRRHVEGELHLDRTLLGLADRSRLGTPARESAWAGWAACSCLVLKRASMLFHPGVVHVRPSADARTPAILTRRATSPTPCATAVPAGA